MYCANEYGFQRNTYIRKESIKIFFIVFPVLILMIFISYLSMYDWEIFFYVFVLPFSVFMFSFFTYITLLMIKRWNHTIKKIEITHDKIAIQTFSTLGLKAINLNIFDSNIKIKSTSFSWYSKENKEGIMIIIKDKDLYIVKDYFDEFDEIAKLLSANNQM